MAATILLQIKKWRWGRLSQISRGNLSEVVCVCVCLCVCYNTIVVYTIHHRKLCTCMFGTCKIFCRTLCFLILQRTKLNYSIFRYKRPKRVVGALHFYTSNERIAREASCIEPYFSLQIHANPSWLTVYRHRKCAVTQIHSTAVNTTIST